MLFDISRKLFDGMAVWPGDTPYSIEQTMAIAAGDSVNLTTLTFSAHTGTHIDAPLHYAAAGQPIDVLELSPFWGLAQVVTVTRQNGPLVPADFDGYDLSRAPRLLVRTPLSNIRIDHFPEQFAYPSPEFVDYLATLGLVLYGTDAPSMDAADSKALDGHHALARHRIAILEWLDLSQVEDGLYELVALPLRIAGGDGSPVRAVLRTISQDQAESHSPYNGIVDDILLDIEDEAG